MTNEWFGRFHDDDWESWNAYPEALKATGHKALEMLLKGGRDGNNPFPPKAKKNIQYPQDGAQSE